MDLFYPILPNKKTDTKRREISIDYPDSYSKTFISNVVKQIPKVYIEYFDYFMNKVPLYEPQHKIFHVLMIENLFFTYFLLINKL